MARTATITTRVSPEIKASADALFSGLGLNTSEAISIFLHRALACRGLPFDVAEERPNAETRAALDEADAMIRGDIPKPPPLTTDEFFAEMRASGEI